VRHYLDTGVALPGPLLRERVAMAIEHGVLLIADKGEKIGVREMRKHISWYLKGFYGAAHFREEVMRLTRWDEVVALLRRVENDESLARAITRPEAEEALLADDLTEYAYAGKDTDE
jgi:tRNA-dihydrouridine synthase